MGVLVLGQAARLAHHCQQCQSHLLARVVSPPRPQSGSEKASEEGCPWTMRMKRTSWWLRLLCRRDFCSTPPPAPLTAPLAHSPAARLLQLTATAFRSSSGAFCRRASGRAPGPPTQRRRCSCCINLRCSSATTVPKINFFSFSPACPLLLLMLLLLLLPPPLVVVVAAVWHRRGCHRQVVSGSKLCPPLRYHRVGGTTALSLICSRLWDPHSLQNQSGAIRNWEGGL